MLATLGTRLNGLTRQYARSTSVTDTNDDPDSPRVSKPRATKFDAPAAVAVGINILAVVDEALGDNVYTSVATNKRPGF